jgi:hypothetical protein
MLDEVSDSLELCRQMPVIVHNLLVEIAFPRVGIESIYQILVICEDREWFFSHQEAPELISCLDSREGIFLDHSCDSLKDQLRLMSLLSCFQL